MKIITLLTDFGTIDGYVGQMKGVISQISDAKIIDVTHGVSGHNIREAAFILRNVVSFFPVGSIHIVVVDPGVGTDRKGIFITTKSQVLVGPDNGVLMPAARLLGDFTVYEIQNMKYVQDFVSHTFHGRDVFAPVAAHISNGVSFDKIGSRASNFVDLDFEVCSINKNSASGKVIYIDHFGNLITNIDGVRLLDLLKFDEKCMVFLGDHSLKIPFVRSYGFVNKKDCLATIGSSNFLEIGINQGNAAKKLKVKEDTAVKILFS